MNSSHLIKILLADQNNSCYTEHMRIEKDHDSIPQGCIERHFPLHMQKDTVFSDMGIRGGGISSATKGFVIKRPGKRTYHILIITISGEGKFLMENNSTVVTRSGDIFFSHANGHGHIHQTETSPWVFFWLQFNISHNWLIPPFGDWGLIPSQNMNNILRLKAILETIFDEESSLGTDSDRLQRLYAELFMIYLQRELRTGDDECFKRYRNQFSQLWQAIAASPSKTWTLKTISNFVGLSRAQFYRVCVLLYQKSPGEKVKEIRMEHSLSLLRHFDCQISEVAERIGYKNMSSFSVAFKKYFGYSPREAVKLS